MSDRLKIIFDYVKKHFGTEPEYLWKNDSNSAVFRNGFNKKWYAIIMKVRNETLKLGGSGYAWILNVKCEPMMIGLFLNRKGFLPAYHMNKEHWMSIVLEDSGIEIE